MPKKTASYPLPICRPHLNLLPKLGQLFSKSSCRSHEANQLATSVPILCSKIKYLIMQLGHNHRRFLATAYSGVVG